MLDMLDMSPTQKQHQNHKRPTASAVSDLQEYNMTRDELLMYHDELCTAAKDLMSLKNRDYAGNHGNEPFANFTRVEAMGICTTEQGFMTRITDKMSRLSSFIDCGKMHVANESFNDTIVDVINYMVLLSAYLKDKESQDDPQLMLFDGNDKSVSDADIPPLPEGFSFSVGSESC